MKKILSFVRTYLPVAFVLISLPVLLSACLKNDKAETPDIPAAGLMAFNLAPDQQSVAIRLSGISLTQTPLAYTSFTGVYQSIYVGERQVQSFDFPDTNPLASGNYNFEKDQYYSLFLVGGENHYRNIITKDNLDSLPTGTGNAYIRYINAITDSVNAPAVTVASSGTPVFSETPAFGTVSDFKAVAPGELAIAVNGNSVDTTRNITVQENKIYTILLVGQPGNADAFRKPQIKYIQNGTLASDSAQ